MFVDHLKVRPPRARPAWIERPLATRVEAHGGVVSIVAGAAAAAQYERWKTAYRATVGAEAPDFWRPPVFSRC